MQSRQIKFRAWDEQKRGWKGLWIFRGGHSKEYDVSNTGIDLLDLTNKWGSHVILQQFTGLYDYKGKEIYEGDIIECFGGEQSQGFYEISIKGLMVYSYNAFLIKDTKDVHYDPSHFDCKLRIIGNIYENPEWLNESLSTNNTTT